MSSHIRRLNDPLFVCVAVHVLQVSGEFPLSVTLATSSPLDPENFGFIKAQRRGVMRFEELTCRE